MANLLPIPDRITDLKRKLKARRGNAQFNENTKALEAEIARLEALNNV